MMRESGDSAVYMQVSWSILNGSPFTTSIFEHLPRIPQNFLGEQLAFTLSLFSPLTILHNSGILFLCIQIIIIVTAAIYLFLLSILHMENRWIPLLIILCFLFNTATVLSFSHFGFRVETLFIPCIIAIFYYITKEKYVPATIALLLTLLTKHNSIGVVLMMGLYFLIISRKHWKYGIFCVVLSITYYFIGVEFIMTSFQINPQGHFKHFDDFGGTALEAFGNIILHPSLVFNQLTEVKIGHILSIVLPAGLLAIFTPVFWISLPQLIMNMVITDYHAVFCGWHWALVVPYLFIALVYSISFLLRLAEHKTYNRFVVSSIIILLLADISFKLIQYDKNVLLRLERITESRESVSIGRVNEKLSTIPDSASLMVSGNLLWFTFARQEVYTSDRLFHADVDYIAVLFPTNTLNHKDKHLLPEINNFFKLKKSKLDDFTVIYHDNELIIFQNTSRL
ncbi:DUF2079 domain-containing protein [Thermodesulfobacteriota bacterium]